MFNRGFTAMLPNQGKKEKKPVYDFKIGFTLLKREFSFKFKVKKEE